MAGARSHGLVLRARPIIIAHRGASGTAPENTRAAFRKALRDGADGLELDLRWTRDRRIAVIHDATVDRTTRSGGPVRAMTMARLQQLDAGSWFARRFRGEGVPALEEVLRLGRPCRLLILDTKDMGTSWIAGVQGLPVLIASEFPAFHEAVRRRHPWARRALTAETRHGLSMAKRLGCAAIDPRWRLVDAAFMRRARALGLAVYPWTVNEPKVAARLARLGVDGVITNFPGPVREALEGCGRDWPKGYFEKVPGSWKGGLGRPRQDPPQEREPL